MLGCPGCRAGFARRAPPLVLLHKQAAEERMARSVDSFYSGREPALPIGVRSSRRGADADVPA